MDAENVEMWKMEVLSEFAKVGMDAEDSGPTGICLGAYTPSLIHILQDVDRRCLQINFPVN